VPQVAEPQNNLISFGHGKAGSLMALARAVLQQSDMWVYGGFLRDFVVRGEMPMDLDLGLPTGGGMDAATGMKKIAQLANGLGMVFVRNQPGGDKVCTTFFKTVDGTNEVEVQVRAIR
jgi:hypothetical protein